MINSSSSYRIYHMRTRTSHTAPGKIKTVSKFKQAFLQLAAHNWFSYFIQAAVWMLLYFFPAILHIVSGSAIWFGFSEPANPVYLLSFVLLIGFSYFNHYWLVPVFFLTETFFTYFLLLAVSLALMNAVQFLAAIELTASLSYYLNGLNYTLLLFIISTLTSIIIQLKSAVAACKKENSKLKQLYLNNQVKPHFLFHTLNWIYSLSAEGSKETPQAISQLSGMMKHLLKEPGEDFTDLSKELDYIGNYISLQQARLGDTVLVSCTIPVYKGKAKIAPLLIMSFIENAFRHGTGLHEDAAIRIDISLISNKLFVHVINNKIPATHQKKFSGAGINNAQQRLQLLYPYTHQLEILENEKIYSVNLSINIL